MSAALEMLRELCLSPERDLDERTWRYVAERLKSRGWLSAAEPIVNSLLEDDEVQPWAGGLWSRIKIGQSDWDAYKQLRPLLQKGPVGERAALVWIQELVLRSEGIQLLRLASLGEHWLRRYTPAWGAMAEALRTLHVQQPGYFWTWRWQDLPDLTSRDLLNVSEILRANHRCAEGALANTAALERDPGHALCAVHTCWLAADEVILRDFEAAEARLHRIDPALFSPENRLLQTLVTAAVSAGRADAARRPEVLSDARQSIDTACREHRDLRRDPARIRLLREVISQWGEDGGLGVRLWCWWRGWRL